MLAALWQSTAGERPWVVAWVQPVSEPFSS